MAYSHRTLAKVHMEMIHKACDVPIALVVWMECVQILDLYGQQQ